MPSLGDFIHAQYLLKIPIPTHSFASRTILITGANGGLGQETAQHFVRLGASKVILACRSLAKGKITKLAIEKALGCGPSVLEVWELDLESPSSISALVSRVNTLERVDVVVNNAGIHTMSGFRTVYGTERALGVNTIGTFLLAFQLLPKMKETAGRYVVTPVMTTVTSALYEGAKYPEGCEDAFAWCADEGNVEATGMAAQYDLSKLLQVYVLIRLAERVDGLGNDLAGVVKVFMKVFQAMTARTAEEGARLVVQSASAGREQHGKYMRCGEVRAYHPVALDKNMGDEVWRALCNRLQELQPGVMRCLE
ncbi:hypothetical protein B0T14DRAFT_535653 [Immersiella caudata]|uniref:Uncharacterized protein n=1 Tax=Immersiella caudata TaxID=314043 RepID=A0AA39WW77_9PEZI|nr:hypothetical protein B0T14DRAFT_535653 [Immersiella caudata]